MFDDLQKQAGVLPENLPTEPVDMFAGVDNKLTVEKPAVQVLPDALSKGMLKKAPVESMAGREMSPPNNMVPKVVEQSQVYGLKGPILGKILLGIVALAVVGGGGYFAWKFFSKDNAVPAVIFDSTIINNQLTGGTSATTTSKSDSTTNDVSTVTSTDKDASTTATTFFASSTDISNKISNDSILFGEAIDSDKDSLDDVREKEIGTNPKKADSDSDGLKDGDEAIIWKTNPLNTDTDGDGYKDGDEVKNGYNPLGTGKLVSVSTSTK